MTGSLLELAAVHSPAALALLRGPDFIVAWTNPACDALCEGMAGKALADVWPEAAPVLLPRLRAVREGGIPYSAAGCAAPRRPPGPPAEDRYFDFTYVPLTESGEVVVLMAASEVTAHRSVEAELRAVCAELAAIHASAPVALFVVNQDLRVEKVNDLAAGLAGRPAAELVGRQPGEVLGCLRALADPGDCGRARDCVNCAIRAAVLDSLRTGESHRGVQAWVPRAGANSCLLVSSSPLRSDGACKVLVCVQDITAQKRTQLALESALAEKTILLQEVHHRVKNNLAVISSLLSMKADAVANATAKDALLNSQQRVYSMALIHEQLYANARLDRIDFAAYAGELVRRLHAAMAREPKRIAIDLSLDPIDLAIEEAVPCGLILNELLTNTFKYAFPGRRRGRIAIAFRESDAGVRELSVEDDGVGMPACPGDGGTALGLRIVEVLARQLDGTLEYQPCAGTRAVLRFPGGKR